MSINLKIMDEAMKILSIEKDLEHDNPLTLLNLKELFKIYNIRLSEWEENNLRQSEWEDNYLEY